jgi:hypothetical protein
MKCRVWWWWWWWCWWCWWWWCSRPMLDVEDWDRLPVSRLDECCHIWQRGSCQNQLHGSCQNQLHDVWLGSSRTKRSKNQGLIRASSADDHALEAMDGGCVASSWGSVVRIGLVNVPRCADLCRPRRIAGAGNHRGGCSLGSAMRGYVQPAITFAIVLRRIRREECKLGDEVIAHALPLFAAGLHVARQKVV